MASVIETREAAREHGVSEELLQFLMKYFSRPGHHHSTKQIDGLKEAVEKIVEDDDEGHEDYDDEEDEEEDDE